MKSKDVDDRSKTNTPERPALPVGVCSMWTPVREAKLESWQRGEPDPRHGALFGLG